MMFRFTDPERVVDATTGATKRALAEYYFAIAKPLLVHVAGRPLAFLRCPNGVDAQCFFQRRGSEAMAIHDPRSLIDLVQRGFVELHVRGAHVVRMERPDVMVFDLDPDVATPFPWVARSALLLREGLAAMGLTSFVKTTGGHGLHVCVPIDPCALWTEVEAFSARVATELVRVLPNDFVLMASKRTATRIFVDHRCNVRGATTIAPYSVRAVPGLTVAMPLAWDELLMVDPRDFTIATVPRIVAERADPWAAFATVEQRLPALRRAGAPLRSVPHAVSA